MTSQTKELLLAFYGDDFTGSTDALEFLSRAGANTVLFIEPPTSEQLKHYHHLDAIGVAGMTRAMTPEKMEKELRSAFTALHSSGAAHVHYKICSTFDSSPTIGSIGKAIDVGAEIFRSEFIPLLVAAPALGRYCLFGNLFARMGIGSKGTIYRLDRHPSMKAHPVTPADESDLRIHLSRQTTKQIGLMDILQIAMSEEEAENSLKVILRNGVEIVLFDAVYEDQLGGIGKLIARYGSREKPLFSVGSSGVEMALGAHWQREGVLKSSQNWMKPGHADSLLVASGSCSPVTAGQIAWALENGFIEVPLDIEPIIQSGSSLFNIDDYVSRIISFIKEGHNVILHTSRGNQDTRIDRTSEILRNKGFDQSMIRAQTAQLYGSVLGRIVRCVSEKIGLKRILIAGGDTSSFAAREMGIESVQMIAPLSPGAPLCKAHAPGSSIDGLEINFKGGQVGGENYFGMVLEGGGISI